MVGGGFVNVAHWSDSGEANVGGNGVREGWCVFGIGSQRKSISSRHVKTRQRVLVMMSLKNANSFSATPN